MNDFREDIKACLQVLSEGGIILYPTDTVWGLGCDATQEAAVQKLEQIKGKEAGKGMIVLLEHAGRLPAWVDEVPEVAWELTELSEKPLTIIYEGAKNLAPSLPAADGSVGIRICKEPFVQALLKQFRKPLVSTSANLSGEPTPENFGGISEAVIQQADYVVHWRQEDKSRTVSSSILRLGKKGEVQILRT